MTDPSEERRTIKPFEDADAEPPVPAGEPSRTTEEASRRDLAIRGAAAGGALSGSAGYAGGAMAGTGGAIGARLPDVDEPDVDEPDADEPEADDFDGMFDARPELRAEVAPGPPDSAGIDEPAGAAQLGGRDERRP
jgi:hypothetical protein